MALSANFATSHKPPTPATTLYLKFLLSEINLCRESFYYQAFFVPDIRNF